MVKYWKAGGRWDIWAYELSYVEKFIKENDLQPLDKMTAAAYVIKEDSPEMMGPAIQPFAKLMEKRGMSMSIWEDYHGIYGGMRVSHLHFRGEIYMLKNKQWAEFSGKMLEQFSNKLGEANAVSFDQLMNVSQTVNTLG